MVKRFAIILFALVFLTSCDVIKSFTSEKHVTKSGDMLFEDDFSRSPNGWGTVMGREGGAIDFEYQGLAITVNLPNYLYWTVNGGKFTDTKIDVDAVLLEGPPNDNLGVICRFQDNENFYGFLISNDGYYGIFKMIAGKMVMSSAEGNMNFSDVIRQGGVVNHIQAECSGNMLSLTVNDTVLAEVLDDSFDAGQIGLIAGAYEFPGVKVLFDNLRVIQP